MRPHRLVAAQLTDPVRDVAAEPRQTDERVVPRRPAARHRVVAPARTVAPDSANVAASAPNAIGVPAERDEARRPAPVRARSPPPPTPAADRWRRRGRRARRRGARARAGPRRRGPRARRPCRVRPRGSAATPLSRWIDTSRVTSTTTRPTSVRTITRRCARPVGQRARGQPEQHRGHRLGRRHHADGDRALRRRVRRQRQGDERQLVTEDRGPSGAAHSRWKSGHVRLPFTRLRRGRRRPKGESW